MIVIDLPQFQQLHSSHHCWSSSIPPSWCLHCGAGGPLCIGVLLAGSPAHQVTLCFGDNVLRADHLTWYMWGCVILCVGTLKACISHARSTLLPSSAFSERLSSHKMRLNLLLWGGPGPRLSAVWPSTDIVDRQIGLRWVVLNRMQLLGSLCMERSSSDGVDNRALGPIQLRELPEAVWTCVKKENLWDAELSFYLPEMSQFIPLG